MDYTTLVKVEDYGGKGDMPGERHNFSLKGRVEKVKCINSRSRTHKA